MRRVSLNSNLDFLITLLILFLDQHPMVMAVLRRFTKKTIVSSVDFEKCQSYSFFLVRRCDIGNVIFREKTLPNYPSCSRSQVITLETLSTQYEKLGKHPDLSRKENIVIDFGIIQKDPEIKWSEVQIFSRLRGFLPLIYWAHQEYRNE